jgi:hypothetical protein
MTFKEIILEWLITENKEEIYQKYYSDIDRRLFLRIIQGDPKTVVVGDKMEKVGKHAKLLLNMYRNNKLTIEDLANAKEYLELIYKYNVSLNYNEIQTIPDLYQLVKDKMALVSTSLSKLISLLESNEYFVQHNGTKWFIITPITEKAAAYLGVNAEWCTTWGKYSLNPKHKDKTNHFNSFKNKDKLYIIVNKENENEKYQIHFPNNEFKNAANSEVSSRRTFLKNNEEIKRYFFPALYETTPSKEEVKSAISRGFKFLDESDMDIIREKFIAFFSKDNQLVSALHYEDEEMLNEFINTEEFEFSFRNNSLEIEFKTLPNFLDLYERALSYLKGVANDSYNYVYDGEYSDWSYNSRDTVEGYLTNYYEINKQSLISKFGNISKTYDVFVDHFIEGILEDDKIKDKYLDKFTDGTGAALSTACNEEVNKFESILEIDKRYSYSYSYRSSTVSASTEKLIDFIAEKEILVIEDFESFLEDYMSYYDLPDTDYVELPEYDYVYPDQEFMNEILDDYFDIIEEEINNELENSAEYSKECLDKKNKLLNITGKHFNEKNIFENEFVIIELEKNWIRNFDCQDGVTVNFTNKKTNEVFNGSMQVDSLIDHMNIEPLFENLKFKNILKELKKGAK